MKKLKKYFKYNNFNQYIFIILKFPIIPNNFIKITTSSSGTMFVDNIYLILRLQNLMIIISRILQEVPSRIDLVLALLRVLLSLLAIEILLVIRFYILNVLVELVLGF